MFLSVSSFVAAGFAKFNLGTSVTNYLVENTSICDIELQMVNNSNIARRVSPTRLLSVFSSFSSVLLLFHSVYFLRLSSFLI